MTHCTTILKVETRGVCGLPKSCKTDIRNNPGVWLRIKSRGVTRRKGHRRRPSGSARTHRSRTARKTAIDSSMTSIGNNLRSAPSGNHVIRSIRTSGLSRKNRPNERRTLHPVVYPMIARSGNRMNNRPLPLRMNGILMCNVAY